jgi:plasmid stabilization system protein ParE
VPAVEFLPEASEEMIAAAEWYEERRTGAGARFLSEVLRYTEILRAHPSGGAPVQDRRGRALRALSMRAFPYRIVYRPGPSTLLIVAVAHTSRRPNYWRSRVR